MDKNIIENVKEYYGKVLNSNKDLKTNACCTSESIPSHLRPLLGQIHSEIKDKFFGCGSPIPTHLKGKTVLDLGCGTGRDTYLMSKLVGEEGKVIGVDMTEEQIVIAKKYQTYHKDIFGHKNSNVEFHLGFIEDLASLNIASNSIDVVISNCVINLSPNKDRVFSEIFRVLKPGGELYFSDIFSTRRIPESLDHDPLLRGECLSGALYIEDFRRLLLKFNVADYRVVSQSPITTFSEDIARKLAGISFNSFTIRAFKLDLEDRCEDYGQVAIYLGTIAETPQAFLLDDHHLFEKNRPVPVCKNTAQMLLETRFGEHFKILGNADTHFGLFDCGPSGGVVSVSEKASSGACC